MLHLLARARAGALLAVAAAGLAAAPARAADAPTTPLPLSTPNGQVFNQANFSDGKFFWNKPLIQGWDGSQARSLLVDPATGALLVLAPLGPGAATAAGQTAQAGVLATIATNTAAASTAGLAKEAGGNLAAIAASTAAGATAAGQATANGSLATIVTNTGVRPAIAGSDASGSVATANTYQQLQGVTPGRQGCTVTNSSTATISVKVTDAGGSTVTVLSPGQPFYCGPPGAVDRGAVSITSATAGAQFSARFF